MALIEAGIFTLAFRYGRPGEVDEAGITHRGEVFKDPYGHSGLEIDIAPRSRLRLQC